jgi:GGDEF domain-containing protein
MGGDEFCVLSKCSGADAAALLAVITAALSDTGDGWDVGCSYGAAWIPSEAATATEAMRLADQRMYANKRTRASARPQVAELLVPGIGG